MRHGASESVVLPIDEVREVMSRRRYASSGMHTPACSRTRARPDHHRLWDVTHWDEVIDDLGGSLAGWSGAHVRNARRSTATGLSCTPVRPGAQHSSLTRSMSSSIL